MNWFDMKLLMRLFQALILVFLLSSFSILYFALKRKASIFPIMDSNYRYDVKTDQSENLQISTTIKLIPMPKSVNLEDSILLITSNRFQIISKQEISHDLELAIKRYSKYIELLIDSSSDTSQTPSSENILVIDCLIMHTEKGSYPKLGEDESYKLNIKKTGVYLNAATMTGVIRGLSTFVQLIEQTTLSSGLEQRYIRLGSIVDQPRYPWRGLLLDVSRHWMPVPVIERTLNAMELSKLNVLHFHLSDDQGFRVESLQHPLLHDRKDYFTQKDIRYLVEYARQRRIRIVPEFDIPGHTTSWFIGYPELATEPGPYKVGTRWGVMKPTMDPTKESTYTFLDSFFQEMTTLFPDPYFHIGGDEVEGSHWRRSESIQNFTVQNRLGDKVGLQAYFTRRIQTMLKKYNKTMIGWEEILHEVSEKLAVDNDAIIQAWMSKGALVNAIKRGYRGILSNGYYLDHLRTSLDHYSVDPNVDDELKPLNAEQKSRILGGEACMWAEFASENNVDSRLWPRTIAIAEQFWSSVSTDNKNSLYERLFRMSHLLDKMQTGLTHLSLYKTRLQNLISDPDKKNTLLHPLTILADACEPLGLSERSPTGRYTSMTPLTTFADALQPESELIWKLGTLPIDDEKFSEIFKLWSVNYIRLQHLFDVINNNDRQLWGQDLEKLSKNLAQTGLIGLRILNYKAKKQLHPDVNNTMNSWKLRHWLYHHHDILVNLESEVREIRLAAVRTVGRLLNSIPRTD